MSGDLAAAWSKLEETAARIALVFHCVKQVASHVNDQRKCDVDSMSAAIALTEWFKTEAQRIQLVLSESPEERKRRQLAEWIKSRGGRVRERDLVSGRRDIDNADQANLSLQSQVEAGFGEWQDVLPGSTGGRPTREFVLFP